ncbi:MAG: patatin-like phospholipase family protein, partial [Acidobacteriota bacterium]
AYLTEHCPDAPPIDTFENVIDPYIIEVNFENASDIEGEDPDYYLSLPTSFRLDPEQVEKLVNIGPKLLRASPQYQCLVAVLDAEARGLPRPEQCPVGAGISGVEEEDS